MKTKVVEHVPRIIFHVLQNIPGSKLLSDIQTFLAGNQLYDIECNRGG